MIAELAPEVVYVAAAMANVEACEQRPREAWLVNVAGLRNVVQAASSVDAVLVVFSTDYIFDGMSGPYREDEPANPINEYGRQKVIGEQYVALHAERFLIVRTTGVYGRERHDKNFVASLVASLRSRREVRVPVDQVGSPTYAPNLAAIVVDLVRAGVRGVVNVAGPERASRVALAHEAAEVFGLDSHLVVPVSTRDLGQQAARPLEAGLLVDTLGRRTAVPLVGYHEGLRLMAAAERP